MNESRWEKMAPGDVVLIYNNGRICFAGEIAAKVRNRELARHFWKEDETGSTWELMYFIVNEERTGAANRFGVHPPNGQGQRVFDGPGAPK